MGANLKFYVINMDKDKDRLESFSKQMENHGLEFERHVGPLLTENCVSFLDKTYKVHAKGYAGVAMAHLTLWEKVSKLEDDTLLCNVFEDDELLKENYLQNLNAELEKIDEDIDFFNLNVIRPLGKEIAPDVLKISDKKFGKKFPNIWLSNYIITPKGARKILSLLSENMKSLNVNFDRTFVKIIHEECECLNCFVMKPQDKLSIHDEDVSSNQNPFYIGSYDMDRHLVAVSYVREL